MPLHVERLESRLCLTASGIDVPPPPAAPPDAIAIAQAQAAIQQQIVQLYALARQLAELQPIIAAIAQAQADALNAATNGTKVDR